MRWKAFALKVCCVQPLDRLLLTFLLAFHFVYISVFSFRTAEFTCGPGLSFFEKAVFFFSGINLFISVSCLVLARVYFSLVFQLSLALRLHVCVFFFCFGASFLFFCFTFGLPFFLFLFCFSTFDVHIYRNSYTRIYTNIKYAHVYGQRRLCNHF